MPVRRCQFPYCSWRPRLTTSSARRDRSGVRFLSVEKVHKVLSRGYSLVRLDDWQALTFTFPAGFFVFAAASTPFLLVQFFYFFIFLYFLVHPLSGNSSKDGSIGRWRIQPRTEAVALFPMLGYEHNFSPSPLPCRLRCGCCLRPR